MRKRYKTFEEGEKGENFVAISNNSQENYANPPIPIGYKHIQEEWHNGFVIRRNSDGSEFVWVPVGYLNANGTIDGICFDQKFGRRDYRCNYRKRKFSEDDVKKIEELRKQTGSEDGYYIVENDISLVCIDPNKHIDSLNLYKEFSGNIYRRDKFPICAFPEIKEIPKEFLEQRKSIKKYGGFYISRYNISRSKYGKPQSLRGRKPWANISIFEAQEIARNFENSLTITSHLTYGSEYDSVLEWFIKSGARKRNDITNHSEKWGNYWKSKKSPRKRVKTGSKKNWCTNNIYDFAGNMAEWTQEYYRFFGKYALRGGNYDNHIGDGYPVSYRNFDIDPSIGYENASFRIVLCLK